MSVLKRTPQTEIMDTTLRDGLQSPEGPNHGKFSLNIPERLQIFTALVQYGIRHVEVFAPNVNTIDHDVLHEYLRLRDQLAPEFGYANIHVHVRATEVDVEAALAVRRNGRGVDGLNMYMGTSPFSIKSNHRQNLTEIARRSSQLLAEVRHQQPELDLRFSGEDAFRTPLADLFTVYDEIAPYVDYLGTPDTFGHALPNEVADRVTALTVRYCQGDHQIGLEGHFHNDLGLAMANTLVGIMSGMTRIDTSILGLAERSGITSLTALLYALDCKYQNFPELTAGYHLENSYALNVLVASIYHLEVNDAVSLTAATHSAGVHGAAVLRDPETYQDPNLRKFGVDSSIVLLGPYSGWTVIEYFLTQILYFQGVTAEIAKQLTPIFKNRCAYIAPNCQPKELLQQVAVEFGLHQILPPATHQEIIAAIILKPQGIYVTFN